MKILVVLLLFLVNISQAQLPSITGKLIDGSNSPVPFATVMLKQQSDSTLVKGEVTDEAGVFIFQDVNAGKYFLLVQAIGFMELIRELEVTSAAVNLGSLTMSQSAQELSAVTVEAEKPFIERQSDKMVVNVENSIIHEGSTVMDVFRKMPGVIVDQDDNIRLRGKQGVIVVIDGKPVTMSGQDLANMLKGMSASNVQKIEIITNPSARWDASGNAGILNIVMKKNKLDGYNGNVSFTYGQGRFPKYNASTSLNYKKDRFNFFFNYAYSNRKGFNNLMINRKFFNVGQLVETYVTDNYIILPFETHNPRIGVDYNVTDKTTLSFLGTVLDNTFKPLTDNHSDILGVSNEKTRSLDFSQTSNYTSFNYELNGQVIHRFDTNGQVLNINLDYGSYDNSSKQFLSTLVTDYQNNTSGYVNQESEHDGLLDLYSVKADYTKPFKKNITLEAGFKSSIVESDKDMRFYNTVNDGLLYDSARSSHFLYSENINAGYVSLQKKFKKLSVQAGLRAEQTVADGLQLLNNKSFDRNYFQLFPTAYLNYETGKHNINANIGRRITRPHYEQLNPYRRLIDFTTFSEGNPFLLPELSYVTELSYSYDNTYFVSLNFSRANDNITDVLIQDATTRTTIQSVVNLEDMEFYSIDLSYSKRLTSFWKTNTNWQGYYYRVSGTVHNLAISRGKPTFSAGTNNSFTLSQSLSAELSLRYDYTNVYGVTTMREAWNLTAGFQKSIMKKRGTLTLNVTDIFWKAWPSGLTEFGDVTEAWVSKRETRAAYLGFSYNFGKGKTGRMRRNTGADEEKSRIG